MKASSFYFLRPFHRFNGSENEVQSGIASSSDCVPLVEELEVTK